MNYSKQYINEIAQKSGFLANNTEKVIRLLAIFKKRCAENNIKLTLFTHTENVLKQGYFGENK